PKKVFAAALAAQLGRADASDCGPGEYPVGEECCPMCAAGLRVFKHCTAYSSRTCVPCVGDTYTDHPNGLEHCKNCKLCDKGANLVPEVACTYTKNTVCGCLPGHFCSSVGTEDCEFCHPYTVCFPGDRNPVVLSLTGTKTTDTVCEACPPGTFSTASMPYNCTPQTMESDGAQGEDKNASSNFSVTLTACSVVGVVLAAVVAVLTYIWQRRKRKHYLSGKYEWPGGQQGQALVLTAQNDDQTTVPMQEIGADSEEIRPT
ncbi:TNR14 factor, partial [Trogon melanurus]|nr:TNR14 factor [Trogon melanurus]